MATEDAPLRARQRPIMPSRHPFAMPERLQRTLARGQAAIAEPFRGITADGQVTPGLFPLARTGISPQPIVAAALALLAALSPAQQEDARFPLDGDGWRGWSNIHPFLMRRGILLETLSEAQREAALGLLRASLSAAGYATARDVMKLNEHILEITHRDAEFGEWVYWLSLFGEPSATEPWGWQIDGHHLVVNCLVLGDQLVLTPNFMGSEPVEARFGKYAGTQILAAEESQGFALMNALSAEQQQAARIGMTLPGEVLAGMFEDNRVMRPEGLRHGDLSAAQQALLLDLIGLYIGRAPLGHAGLDLDRVRRHLADTHFAWIGGCDATSPFYYRIQSPVILIEFDHEPGIALDNDEPSRRHVHTLVRTPNGNDYGKDLLRQHYARFDHGDPRSPHRQGKE